MDGWFYESDGERRGPLTVEQVKQLVAAGAIRRQTRVWRPGANLTDLTRAGDFLAELSTPPPVDDHLVHLLPVNRSGWAIAAGYLGLFSFVPLVCFVGLAVSIHAARQLKRHPEKLGWGRVITGLVLSGLFSLIHIIVICGLFKR